MTVEICSGDNDLNSTLDSGRQKTSKNSVMLEMKLAYFHLKDRNKVGSEVSPEEQEVFI